MSSSSEPPAHSQAPPLARREMKVLCLGLPRTGSTSIAEALSILGFQGVHHTSKGIYNMREWDVLDRAADATFPCLPTYTGQPFTRADWDELYGSYEATTDASSMFAPELIRTYPEAKVLLVERDYDKWHRSVFDSLVATVWSPMTNFSLRFIEPLIGFRGGTATRKLILGLFDAATPEEARRNARMVYDRHGRRIREMVPPEKLLVYRMGDGWEPLCEFLGKDVPDVEFPWLNEAAMLRRIAMEIFVRNSLTAAGVVLPWAAGLGAVVAGVWMVVKR